MSLYSTVTKIFSVEYWRDLEIWVMGQLGPLKFWKWRRSMSYDFILVCRC